MERILITGASGFLGSRLAVLAAGAGHDVLAAYRTNPVPEMPGITPVRLEMTDYVGMDTILRDSSPTVVLHLAYSMSDPQVNIEGTRELVEAVRAMSAQPYFLFTSTDLVFAGRDGNYTEEDDPQPVMDYGRQKLAAERIVREKLPDAAIARPSLIYDLVRKPRHLDFAFEAIKRGETFTFFTDEYRCPVLADELARVILELSGRRLPGIWHTVGAQKVDRWWFGAHLLKALGYEIELARRGLSTDLPGERPADCSLDTGKLRRGLESGLSGAVDVLGHIEVEEVENG